MPVKNIEKFEGSSVFHSAMGMNASACKNELVGVVGDYNSAGQAALFLADHAAEPHVIFRDDDFGPR